MSLLGLDFGEKRIGVAISEGWLAQTLTVIQRRSAERNFAALEALAKEHQVGRIIIGLPLNMDGSLGPQAHKVRAFAQRLRQRLSLEVVEWDERLSTVEAQRIRAETKGTGKGLDAVAAALILQSYLDSQGKGEV